METRKIKPSGITTRLFFLKLMDLIKETSEPLNDKPGLSTLLLWVCIMGIQYSLFVPYYGSNDDTFKIFYAQGVGTDFTPSEFVGYSTPLWGLLFRSLFTLWPHIPWYGIALSAVELLSLYAFLYAFRLSPQPNWKSFLFLLAFFGVFQFFLVKIQFTIVSILAFQSAVLLMVSLWQNTSGEGHRLAWCLSGLLAVLSCLIRIEALLISALCMTPFAFYLLRGESFRTPQRFSTFQKLFFAGLSLILAFAVFYNYYWYAERPAMKEFNCFDHERLELQDYRIDPYNAETKPSFDKAGWSENDYHLFKDWYFMDRDTYDADKMRQLAECFPRIGTEGKPDSYHSPVEFLVYFAPRTLLMYILAFLLMVPLKPIRFLLLHAGWVLLVLSMMIYLSRAPDRIVLPLLAIPLNEALYFSQPGSFLAQGLQMKKKRPLFIAGFLYMLLVFALGFYSYFMFQRVDQQYQAREENLKECLKKLDPQDDHLYVIWDDSFPYVAFNAFDSFDIFRHFHIFALNVYQRSPNAKIMLDRFGVRNLFLDMADNPRVSLICRPEEGAMYQKYMTEKYQMNTYPEVTFQCPYFMVFRIHAKTVSESTKDKDGKTWTGVSRGLSTVGSSPQ